MLNSTIILKDYTCVSASAFGLSISSRGVDFNPSISLSYAFLVKQPPVVRNTSSNNSGQGSATGNTTSGNTVDNANGNSTEQNSAYRLYDNDPRNCDATRINSGRSIIGKTIENGREFYLLDDGSKELVTVLPEIVIESSLIKNNAFKNIATIATILGIHSDAKTGIVESLNLGGKTLGKVLKYTGRALGITGATIDIYKAFQNPSVGSVLKAALSTGLVFVNINPWVGVGIGILEVSGVTDAAAQYIDNSLKK